MDDKMRKPTSDELRLIEYLANKADYDLSADFREHIYVVPIPPILEGELTPLKIIFDNAPDDMKMNGLLVSDCQFLDSDNVPVAVFLLVNDLGYIVELDSWKGDDSPILRIPPSECFMELGGEHSSVWQKIKQIVKRIIG